MVDANRVFDIIPDAEELLALEPEELAWPVLAVLKVRLRNPFSFSRYDFTHEDHFYDYPLGYRKQIARAVMEAWIWLENEGFIAQQPSEQRPLVFLTRRAERINSKEGFESYKKGNLLPRKQLHPTIAQKVWATFLRGDYDTAVFQAFKEVEVAVRDAGKYSQSEIGVKLMRKAFHPETGNLTDKEAEPAEKQSLSDLFVGAIGSYKNPHSHRSVTISAEEAVEMIVLASHLLRIVDNRSESSQKNA